MRTVEVEDLADGARGGVGAEERRVCTSRAEVVGTHHVDVGTGDVGDAGFYFGGWSGQ